MMLNTLRRVGTQRCSNRGLAFKHPLLNPVFTADNALKVDNTIIANRVISMVGDNGRRILLIRKPVLANYKRLAKLLVITPTMARIANAGVITSISTTRIPTIAGVTRN